MLKTSKLTASKVRVTHIIIITYTVFIFICRFEPGDWIKDLEG